MSAKATDSMHTLQSAIFNDDLSYNYGNSISLYTFENKKQRYFKFFDLVKQRIPNYPGDIQLLVTQANNNITSNYTDTVDE